MLAFWTTTSYVKDGDSLLLHGQYQKHWFDFGQCNDSRSARLSKWGCHKLSTFAERRRQQDKMTMRHNSVQYQFWA